VGSNPTSPAIKKGDTYGALDFALFRTLLEQSPDGYMGCKVGGWKKLRKKCFKAKLTTKKTSVLWAAV
jgi:hypothetical protein